VFALGDLTAQAYEGAAVSTIDWARTARSGAVGVIQGPLGHAVFSSDGCLIDRLVEQQVSMLLRQNPSGVALVRLHAAALPRLTRRWRLRLLSDTSFYPTAGEPHPGMQWMLSLATVPATHTMYRPALQGLEQWQQPLAKIAIDQTVLSLAWNSMYFGMLGAMRLDPPGQVCLPAQHHVVMLRSCFGYLIVDVCAGRPQLYLATSCLSLRH
jgi:hypothetical protein